LVTRIDKDKNWHPLRPLEHINPDFVFISIDDCERHHHPKEETFHFYELVYVLSGGLTMWLRGKPVRGGRGDIFIVKPGVPHREESPPEVGARLLCLATGFKRMDGKPCHFPLPLPEKVHLKEGHVVEKCLFAIANEAYHRLPCYSAAIDSHIMQIFIQIVREASAATAPPIDISEIRKRRLISDARKFIERAFSQPLTLKEIAQHFFLSPYHFSRMFKEMSGLPPIAYLNKVRMEKAKRLLLDTDEPVKAIAAKVGFSDPHYFSRSFLKYEGLTPSEFRRKYAVRAE